MNEHVDMDSSPSVTIVTVCLNCLDDVMKTMTSIHEQHFSNRECIVVDGASTDGTLEYLRSMEDSIDLLISEPDRGIYDAMNKGAKHATGDYIIFLNAGDRFAAPDVLEKVMTDEEVVRNRPNLISGRIRYEYDGELLDIYRPVVAAEEDGIDLPHQATFIATDIQQKYAFRTTLRYVGDHDLWRRLEADDLHHVHHIPDVVAIFAFGGASNKPEHDLRRYLERAYVDSQYLSDFGYLQCCKILAKPALRRAVSCFLSEKTYYVLLRFRRELKHRLAWRS